MDYLLFAFGDYTKTDPHINLIVDFVSQISSKEVTYQYGDAGIIVSFTTVKTVDEITEYLEINLTKLTARFFVFPVTDDTIMSMDTEIYTHLFNKTDNLSDMTTQKYVSDMTDIPSFDRILDSKPLDELFNILFKPVETKKVLSLDEILDKIIDKGIDNLTETEKQQLDEYSKK
jgi:hypothetical protein